MENRVYFYGLNGSSGGYRVIRYAYIQGNYSINDLVFQGKNLKTQYPSIEQIYAVDNSYSIYHGFLDAIRGGMEDRVLFKILLETEGIRVV